MTDPHHPECECRACEREREAERQWEADCAADLRDGALELAPTQSDPLLKRRAA
jgi:hypothetical protein